MYSKHLITYIFLLLTLLCALSTSQSYDDDDGGDDSSQENSQEQVSADANSSPVEDLKRGYYFVDNGKITPVQPEAHGYEQRRQDFDSNYYPEHHHTESTTERLFVPNLFG